VVIFDAIHQALQHAYEQYVDGVDIAHQWWVALIWLSFGTLGACGAFWHVGTPIPSFSANLIRRGDCSRSELIGSILYLLVFGGLFAYLISAITIKQLAYAGVMIVVLLTRPSILLAQTRE
jgi:hypothetical protein